MHFEALTDEGKKIFPKLSNFEGFYLAGGTALALQIGHRISVVRVYNHVLSSGEIQQPYLWGSRTVDNAYFYIGILLLFLGSRFSNMLSQRKRNLY